MKNGVNKRLMDEKENNLLNNNINELDSKKELKNKEQIKQQKDIKKSKHTKEMNMFSKIKMGIAWVLIFLAIIFSARAIIFKKYDIFGFNLHIILTRKYGAYNSYFRFSYCKTVARNIIMGI